MTLKTCLLALCLAAIAPAAGAATCASPANAAAEVAVLAEAINRFRASRGLRPLALSAVLSGAGQAHACRMVATGQFSHTVGGSPKTRLRKAGCNARLAGENIAMGYSRGAQVFDQWRTSSGHNKIMSLSGASQMGIGVAAPGPGQGGGPRWVLEVAANCR